MDSGTIARETPAEKKVYDPETETLEDLGRGGMRLIQPRRLFRYGTDSVLLTDFAASRFYRRCVDLGAGSGVIAILLAARNAAARIDCIEYQPLHADICRRNIALNRLEDRVRLYEADLKTVHRETGCEVYDTAVSNPPYFDSEAALKSPDPRRSAARLDGGCTCSELCAAAFRLLKNGGRFSVIYPAARIVNLLGAMKENRIAPKRIRCVQDSPEHACKLILAEGVKNGGEGLIWEKPLYLHDPSGNETEEYKRIYGMEE
ncbi:MAG: methyltransferase [Clostridia bacterium]|nr:methyltransferase [Clostridia bacterium]